MTLPAGIAKSLEILRFARSLKRGRPVAQGGEGVSTAATLERIVSILQALGVPWALVGAHAVNVFVRPRATENVNLVVEGRHIRSVVERLRTELGGGEAVDIGPALRLLDLSIDLIRSDNHPLFRAALDQAQTREGVRVPPPEILVAMKFLSAVSPWRNPADRKQDAAADLIRLYQTLGADLDREATIRHGGSAYPGAERDVRALLDRIDRGEDVQL